MVVLLFKTGCYLVLTIALVALTFLSASIFPKTYAEKLCYRCSGKEACKNPEELINCGWEKGVCWQMLDAQKQVVNLDCVEMHWNGTYKCYKRGMDEMYSCYCKGDRCNGKNQLSGKQLTKMCNLCEDKDQCENPREIECNVLNPNSQQLQSMSKRRCYECELGKCETPHVVECEDMHKGCHLRGYLEASEKGGIQVKYENLGCLEGTHSGEVHWLNFGGSSHYFHVDCGFDLCNNKNIFTESEKSWLMMLTTEKGAE